MQARINPFGTDFFPKFAKYMVSAHKVVAGTALPATTAQLVNIRASQINGCSGCLDMHIKEAEHAGETALRINLVGAWRETTVYTEPERAALELTEHGTRLADGSGVSDEVWETAAKHYDEEQLMALVAQIALINAFNRFNVMTRQVGGNYEVGQLH
ncbi:AhpD family alkylhydroperoxidase [Kribbella amoyensis]|uniref:AhpD family alkylhydroperoxidase n=1 Tax=Kribbella amoyensis TaxID=996641 RepID=A0A561B941_9ACTN|nr:carboxymuconolactone decarboxylase family protein [Kribbella amoyensis]TWD75287.1 AhpD family alkylhydroperoxidase [Kribbella amoyensis]